MKYYELHGERFYAAHGERCTEILRRGQYHIWTNQALNINKNILDRGGRYCSEERYLAVLREACKCLFTSILNEGHVEYLEIQTEQATEHIRLSDSPLSIVEYPGNYYTSSVPSLTIESLVGLFICTDVVKSYQADFDAAAMFPRNKNDKIL